MRIHFKNENENPQKLLWVAEIEGQLWANTQLKEPTIPTENMLVQNAN